MQFRTQASGREFHKSMHIQHAHPHKQAHAQYYNTTPIIKYEGVQCSVVHKLFSSAYFIVDAQTAYAYIDDIRCTLLNAHARLCWNAPVLIRYLFSSTMLVGECFYQC
eukprot:scpid103629/ scgid15005/ 